VEWLAGPFKQMKATQYQDHTIGEVAEHCQQAGGPERYSEMPHTISYGATRDLENQVE
jgi:hypothetical protein